MQIIRILIFFLLFTSVELFAQETIYLKNIDKIVGIGKSLYLYEDKEGNLGIDEIRKAKFQSKFIRSTMDIPNYANSLSTIWCKFTISNLSEQDCLLEIGNAGIHEIELYLPLGNNKFQLRKSGALSPFRYRDYQNNLFLFRLISAVDTLPRTFYLKVKSEETIEIPLSIGTLKAFFEKNHKADVFYGAYFGLMLVMIIYNFFVYTTTSDKSYLYYVGYLISLGLLNSFMGIGYAFEYLWQNNHQLNYYLNVLTAIVCIFMILFSTSFLQTAKNAPKLHRVFYFFWLFCCLIIFLNLSGGYLISSILSQIVSFLLCVYLIALGFIFYKRGLKIARFYLLAWSFLLIGGIIYIVFMNGLLPSWFLIKNAAIVGSSIEAILLSFALADKINVLREEKEKSQAENLRIVQEQNTLLEQKVQERTEEILAQNEELHQQQEEIKAQRDLLARQILQLNEVQSLIHQQNEKLEEQVRQRTQELLETNQELIIHNHQLEQFAFITAHNLRSPVARILGLTNILKPENNSTENDFIIEKLKESSQDLDAVIHDLNLILDIKKGTNEAFEQLNLDEILIETKKNLQETLRESDAEIQVDFSEIKFVYALSPYLKSIFYNLISNAIKYKSPERRAVIFIKTTLDEKYICLSFKDNGLGIDLSKYKEKLFGLYKRFHTHVEGKGLGLHLVKTQVEALGGKIEVESQLNEGTTFFIYLGKPEQ